MEYDRNLTCVYANENPAITLAELKDELQLLLLFGDARVLLEFNCPISHACLGWEKLDNRCEEVRTGILATRQIKTEIGTYKDTVKTIPNHIYSLIGGSWAWKRYRPGERVSDLDILMVINSFNLASIKSVLETFGIQGNFDLKILEKFLSQVPFSMFKFKVIDYSVPYSIHVLDESRAQQITESIRNISTLSFSCYRNTPPSRLNYGPQFSIDGQNSISQLELNYNHQAKTSDQSIVFHSDNIPYVGSLLDMVISGGEIIADSNDGVGQKWLDQLKQLTGNLRNYRDPLPVSRRHLMPNTYKKSLKELIG